MGSDDCVDRQRERTQLAAALENLRAIAPQTRQELLSWYEEARKIEAKLVSRGGLSDEIPEFLWHYLADADVRMKDESYREIQNRKLAVLLSFLRRGEMPSDDDMIKFYSEKELGSE